MLVYLLLLAAVVALGYFTDIVDFTELKAVFSLKLTALLKLAVMVLLVLLVSNLVIFILHGIKPRTHRAGSVHHYRQRRRAGPGGRLQRRESHR